MSNHFLAEQRSIAFIIVRHSDGLFLRTQTSIPKFAIYDFVTSLLDATQFDKKEDAFIYMDCYNLNYDTLCVAGLNVCAFGVERDTNEKED